MTTESLPVVSVILPVFNGAPFLADAIGSVLEQTESRLELLVIDDGSADDSAAIAGGCAATDARVHVFRLDHMGHALAANEGIRRARGSFIATMDADDICLPNRLELQLRHLAGHPHTVGVGGAMIHLLADRTQAGMTRWPAHVSHDPTTLLDNVGMPGPGAMMRAEALRATGGYREAFVLAQDADLWLRLVEIGDIDHLAEPILFYRVHAGQVSRRFAPLQELSGGFARALAQARLDGGEPEWDASLPLSPEGIAAIASRSSPHAKALMHIALSRYYLRLGDQAQAESHFFMAMDAFSGVARSQREFNICWRLIGPSLRRGHWAVPRRLLGSTPGWFGRGMRHRLALWARRD